MRWIAPVCRSMPWVQRETASCMNRLASCAANDPVGNPESSYSNHGDQANIASFRQIQKRSRSRRLMSVPRREDKRERRRTTSTPFSSSPWIAAHTNNRGPSLRPFTTSIGRDIGAWFDNRLIGRSMVSRAPGWTETPPTLNGLRGLSFATYPGFTAIGLNRSLGAFRHEQSH